MLFSTAVSNVATPLKLPTPGSLLANDVPSSFTEKVEALRQKLSQMPAAYLTSLPMLPPPSPPSHLCIRGGVFYKVAASSGHPVLWVILSPPPDLSATFNTTDGSSP